MIINVGSYGRVNTTSQNRFFAEHVVAIAFHEKNLAFLSIVGGSTEMKAIASQLAFRLAPIEFRPYDANGKLVWQEKTLEFLKLEGEKSMIRYPKRLPEVRMDNIVMESGLFHYTVNNVNFIYSDENLEARLRSFLPFAIPEEWLQTFIINAKANRLISPMICYGMEAYVIQKGEDSWLRNLAETAAQYNKTLPYSVQAKLPQL